MKKLLNTTRRRSHVLKFDLKMKLSIVLLLVTFFSLKASDSYSQRTKISLNHNNVSVGELLDEIESTTEFQFVYKIEDVDLERTVSIRADNNKIDKILNQIFGNTTTTFNLYDRRIYLVRRKVTNISKPIKVGAAVPTLQVIIQGVISDVNGTPLPGANILEKGTTNGTQADFDGNFSLKLLEENATLVFSYVGFANKEVEVNGQKQLNIVLEESASGLDEVIVVGYGTQAKKDLTGSVSSVDGDEIASRSTTNVSNALQGSVAGVSVVRNSSAPGSSNDILIRGVTTLQGASNPLILVDNVPVNSIDDVNPDQVESITVLKDGAAASIYGSRAAAGVVIITTKRAKTGIFGLGYSGEYIVNMPTELPGTIGAVRYMQMDNEKSWNDNGNDVNQFPLWSEDLIANYALNNASNPNQFPNTKLTKDDQPITNPTNRALQSAPVYAALWQDNRIAEGKTGDNIYARLKKGGFQSSDTYLFYGMANIFYQPIEELKISLNIAPNFSFNKFKSFNKSIPYWDSDDSNQLLAPSFIGGHNLSQTRLLERRMNNNTLTTQALVNYDKSYKNNNISAVIGYEEFSADFETLGVTGNEFVSNDFPFLNQAPIDKIFNDGTSFSENAYSSYFGRLAYNFKNRYYIQGSVRRDGSSRFGKDYRWGTFPSVSAGWVVSNEKFMESLRPTISFLKLRSSYGSLGNDRLGNYLYQSVLQFSNVLIGNGANVEAVRSAAQLFLAVEDVTWETTTSLNFGLDLYMLNNRLSLTADYFKKETTDMLLDLSIPSLSGYNDPTVNVGSMNTNGWELGLSWKDQIGKINYSTSFNIFDSKSIIGDVRGKRLFSNGDRLLSQEGSEFQSWYGYQSDGIFQNQTEVDNSPVTSDAVAPGDIKYKDISGPDGTPDGIINELDRTVLGGSLPRYQYGGSINLEYKGFDFSLAFQGVGKNDFYLSESFIRPFQESWLSPSEEYANDYWSTYRTQQQNNNARYPRLSENASGNNYRFSDFWLVNGAYLRIKNLTLGYTLPSDVLAASGFSKLRLYISGNDVFTFDSLTKGIDPEQLGDYLITKSYLLGIKVNF